MNLFLFSVALSLLAGIDASYHNGRMYAARSYELDIGSADSSNFNIQRRSLLEDFEARLESRWAELEAELQHRDLSEQAYATHSLYAREPLTPGKIIAAQQAGLAKSRERQANRANNEKVWNNPNTRIGSSSVPPVNQAQRIAKGQKKRIDRNKIRKANENLQGTNNMDVGDMYGTTHTYNKKTDAHMKSKTPADERKSRADSERVVGESLRSPSNDQTGGRGPSAANSVLRSDVHQTKTTKIPDQNVVTSVQRAPGNDKSTVRHLPVETDATGDIHYDNTQHETQFTKFNGGEEAAPANPKQRGSSFTPRSFLKDDLGEELLAAIHRRAIVNLQRRDTLLWDDLEGDKNYY